MSLGNRSQNKLIWLNTIISFTRQYTYLGVTLIPSMSIDIPHRQPKRKISFTHYLRNTISNNSSPYPYRIYYPTQNIIPDIIDVLILLNQIILSITIIQLFTEKIILSFTNLIHYFSCE